MQVPLDTPNESDPYGRLLERLTVALDEADNLAQLSSQPLPDMEVRGLSPDELALIIAYLAKDRAWLNGWHATAARHYQSAVTQPPFQRQPALASRERESECHKP
ncbi:hypothetical protein BVH03_24085 [Pseudomonas sp. PA15(2017)]|uniref:hypothetical protein n=1 Tax=Pseudomonas sp. PA15(2017) TaxID=1932111 RepID=UPI0009639C81|nr:hypothetical protein [Pseudomonas sp. PA15(2017)]OLU23296.1 hypothetical protein BVH03_24085 [Pseudomonas sp. PA15(2017)]